MVSARSREPAVIDLRTGPRTVSLVLPSYGTEVGAAVALEWVETATADRPALLRATLTNRNEFRAKFETHSLPPFDKVCLAMIRGRTYRDSIYLAPTEEHSLVDDEPSYERRPDGHWYAADVPPKQPSAVWLDPDESVTGEYYLLSNAENPTLAPGRYHFGGIQERFTVVIWDADHPGPNRESRLVDSDLSTLPSLPVRDPTAWYHDADAATVAYLEPSDEAAVVPGRIDFEFVNHSREIVEGNPLDWRLFKLHDGEWHHIAPWVIPQPGGETWPGDGENDALRMFHGEPVPCDDGHDVGHLGGGRYAFAVGYESGRYHAAAFDLVGDPVEVTPSDAVEYVERDGDSLFVTASRGDPEDEHSRPAEYTLTRVRDAPSDRRRIIAEQVLQPFPEWRQLRDALGLLLDRDAAEVTLADYFDGTPAFGIRESQFVEYDGRTYRATAEFVDEG